MIQPISTESCCPPLSRREARREARRDAILEVAERSFCEHGYAGTTMSAIAAELGGSKGTLWSYFPSKEELFDAVLDRATVSFREQLTLTLNPDDPIESALTKFCTKLMGKLARPESIMLYRLVIGESARFPEIGRSFYERAPSRTLNLLASYLDAVMKAGKLRKDDSLVAAQHLFAMCVMHMQLKLLTGTVTELTADDAARTVSQAISVFLRAYRQPPDQAD